MTGSVCRQAHGLTDGGEAACPPARGQSMLEGQFRFNVHQPSGHHQVLGHPFTAFGFEDAQLGLDDPVQFGSRDVLVDIRRRIPVGSVAAAQVSRVTGPLLTGPFLSGIRRRTVAPVRAFTVCAGTPKWAITIATAAISTPSSGAPSSGAPSRGATSSGATSSGAIAVGTGTARAPATERTLPPLIAIAPERTIRPLIAAGLASRAGTVLTTAELSPLRALRTLGALPTGTESPRFIAGTRRPAE